MHPYPFFSNEVGMEVFDLEVIDFNRIFKDLVLNLLKLSIAVLFYNFAPYFLSIK